VVVLGRDHDEGIGLADACSEAADLLVGLVLQQRGKFGIGEVEEVDLEVLPGARVLGNPCSDGRCCSPTMLRCYVSSSLKPSTCRR